LNNKGPATIYNALSDEDRNDISNKVSKIVEEIDGAPKTIAWRLRARVGPRKKCYKDLRLSIVSNDVHLYPVSSMENSHGSTFVDGESAHEFLVSKPRRRR
jgi:hypothetical protein